MDVINEVSKIEEAPIQAGDIVYFPHTKEYHLIVSMGTKKLGLVSINGIRKTSDENAMTPEEWRKHWVEHWEYIIYPKREFNLSLKRK